MKQLMRDNNTPSARPEEQRGGGQFEKRLCMVSGTAAILEKWYNGYGTPQLHFATKVLLRSLLAST